MRNWDEIIKIAEDQGEISPQEAKSLRADYELLKEGGVKELLGKSLIKVMEYSRGAWGFVRDPKNLGPIMMASLALPVAAELASVAYRPIKDQMAFKSMKKHLEKISPQDVKDYDDEHIRNVFGMVTTVAPIITANPALAAVAVRDALDVPQSFNVGVLGNLARIQKDSVQGQIGQKARQVSENITGVASKAVGLLSGVAAAAEKASKMPAV